MRRCFVTAAKDVPVEIEAAWLHHRFPQIHPFTGGNGRVARALASLVFLRAGWSSVVVTEAEKRGYIDALEVADSSDLRPLIDMLVRTQRQAFLELLQVRDDVAPPQTLSEALVRVRDVLEQKRALNSKEWQRALDTATLLHSVAVDRLGLAGSGLQQTLVGLVDLRYSVTTRDEGVVPAVALNIKRQHPFYRDRQVRTGGPDLPRLNPRNHEHTDGLVKRPSRRCIPGQLS